MDNVNKKIVLGISGGIAAYKSAELVRLFIKKGYTVKVVMTKSAMEFVRPLTFQTLSQNPVYTEIFDQEQEMKIGHISLARWADYILIAPATANIIAKIAHGIADDLLSTVCLASKVPVIISPAMNEGMWLNPAVQNNISILKSRDISIIGPDSGFQACGEVGQGRMLQPEKILEKFEHRFINSNLPLKGKKIVITAGPTQEAIDPVRFLSNQSSGKMGYAIAEKAVMMGANVTLITGPVCLNCPENLLLIKVKSALEMHSAVMKNIDNADIYISTAAIADYRPKKILEQKHKKTNSDFTITLIKNPDILSEVADLKNPPFTVGFSAETEKLLEYAELKLKKKKLDMIAANLVGNQKAFSTDDNEIIVIDSNLDKYKLGHGLKTELAEKLLQLICKKYQNFCNRTHDLK